MVVSRAIEIEEVAGDLSEDERLQAGEIEHAEVQRLLDGSQEGTGRISAFHLEQATQGTQAAAMGALLEGGGIACEAFMIATQQLLLECGRAARPCRSGMVLRQGVAGGSPAGSTGGGGGLAPPPAGSGVCAG